jgi:Domain of unknown function (DU1801)
MAASKSKQADPGVETFLNGLSDPSRRRDCLALLEIMKKATKSEPKMWGASIVGFGDLHYRYDSGREGDTFVLGFASRKADLTLYLGPALAALEESLKRLGKHKVGKGCLYIRSLADVDLAALRALLSEAATRNAKTAAPRKSDA